MSNNQIRNIVRQLLINENNNYVFSEKKELPVNDSNGKKYKLIIEKGVDNIDETKAELVKKFMKYCCDELGIDKNAEVHLTDKRGGRIQTTASYGIDDDQIWVYVKNRNMLADVLRSIAHEFRHYKQKLDDVLIPTSGQDGSPHENEAHCFAGKAIRVFGKKHPEIFT